MAVRIRYTLAFLIDTQVEEVGQCHVLSSPHEPRVPRDTQ